jgi:hypothetical protein
MATPGGPLGIESRSSRVKDAYTHVCVISLFLWGKTSPWNKMSRSVLTNSMSSTCRLSRCRVNDTRRSTVMSGRPTASIYLRREQPPLSAVPIQFSRNQTDGLQHHRELVGRAPSLVILLGTRHHPPLKPPGFAPLVEGDQVDAQLLGDLRKALAMKWANPLAVIRLDGLAVRTHWLDS